MTAGRLERLRRHHSRLLDTRATIIRKRDEAPTDRHAAFDAALAKYDEMIAKTIDAIEALERARYQRRDAADDRRFTGREEREAAAEAKRERKAARRLELVERDPEPRAVTIKRGSGGL